MVAWKVLTFPCAWTAALFRRACLGQAVSLLLPAAFLRSLPQMGYNPGVGNRQICRCQGHQLVHLVSLWGYPGLLRHLGWGLWFGCKDVVHASPSSLWLGCGPGHSQHLGWKDAPPKRNAEWNGEIVHLKSFHIMQFVDASRVSHPFSFRPSGEVKRNVLWSFALATTMIQSAWSVLALQNCFRKRGDWNSRCRSWWFRIPVDNHLLDGAKTM